METGKKTAIETQNDSGINLKESPAAIEGVFSRGMIFATGHQLFLLSQAYTEKGLNVPVDEQIGHSLIRDKLLPQQVISKKT